MEQLAEPGDELRLGRRKFVGADIVCLAARGVAFDREGDGVGGIGHVHQAEAIVGVADPAKPALTEGVGEAAEDGGIARAVDPGGAENGGGDAAGLLRGVDDGFGLSLGA